MRKGDMNFRLAEKKDIECICSIIASAIEEMENNQIYQWDEIYPAKTDFLEDIEKENLFVGMIDNDFSVLFTLNKECDEQYKNGIWKYPDSEYCVIHRLCVNPKYQNRGVAGKTLNYIEDKLRNSGIETIRLDVFCRNPFALSLYRNNGYIEVGTAWWRKGKFLLMEKHL